jgi:hypothetical protein
MLGGSRPALLRLFPTPGELQLTLALVAQSFGWAFLLLILAGLPAELFNATLGEHEGRIKRRLGGWFPWFARRSPRERRQRGRLPQALGLVLIAGFAAALMIMVDPTQPGPARWRAEWPTVLASLIGLLTAFIVAALLRRQQAHGLVEAALGRGVYGRGLLVHPAPQRPQVVGAAGPGRQRPAPAPGQPPDPVRHVRHLLGAVLGLLQAPGGVPAARAARQRLMPAAASPWPVRAPDRPGATGSRLALPYCAVPAGPARTRRARRASPRRRRGSRVQQG